MNIAFRIDDIYLNNSKFERELLVVFEKNKIPLTLGVIPFNHDGTAHVKMLNVDMLEFLEKNNFEIGVHGYSHKRNEKWGEFFGLSKSKQHELLALSKAHLENLLKSQIDIFIPPWNAMDQNTVEVSENLDFKLISHGHDNRTTKLFSNKLQIIPYSVEHLYFLESWTFKIMVFLSSLGFLQKLHIIILFHPYNFKEWKGENYFKKEKKKFNFDFHKLDKNLEMLSFKKNIKFNNLYIKRDLKKYKNMLFTFLYKIETKRKLILFKY